MIYNSVEFKLEFLISYCFNRIIYRFQFGGPRPSPGDWFPPYEGYPPVSRAFGVVMFSSLICLLYKAVNILMIHLKYCITMKINVVYYI